MKNHVVTLLTMVLCAGFLASCTSDVVTDALHAGYSQPEVVVTEQKDGGYALAAKFTAVLTNRTERLMNVVFLEATIVDAQSGEALVRFRPIVPDSYGSTSTVQLYSGQTSEFPVVTPLDLYGFNPTMHPQVKMKVFYSTEGYRTEAVSGPIIVQTAK